MGGSTESTLHPADDRQYQQYTRPRLSSNSINGATNEMFCPNRGGYVKLAITNHVCSSVCKIETIAGSTATGFFGKLSYRAEEYYGLFTNNHVIGLDYLRSRCQISCKLKDQIVQLHARLYCLTCRLLDATFVQLDEEQKSAIEKIGGMFLTLAMEKSSVTRGTTILVAQHPGGEDLSISIDAVDQLWGCDLYHTASTNFGSSGSPVVSELGLVLGIHKRRDSQEGKNVAVRVWYVTEAIMKDIGRISDQHGYHTPSTTCRLSARHLEQLQQIKLDQIDEFMFVSPASYGVTPIWFMRTCHSWFWTPTNPTDGNTVSNWMRISPHDDLRVIGGFWNGIEPAVKIIRIIRYLQIYGDVFLFE